MNCRTIRSQFDDRLDGRLGPADQPEFDRHLAGCPACRQQWEEHAALWQRLLQHESIEPSFGFADRAIRRLHEPETLPIPAFWRPFVLRWATTASLAIVIGAGSWLGWRRYESVKQAQIYASVQEANFLGEDFDVIASLDELDKGNSL